VKLSPDQIDEIVSLARGYLKGNVSESDVRAWESARDFAHALVQLADTCVVGIPCNRHAEEIHGREAEELRVGVERILRDMGETSPSSSAFRETRKNLSALLDDVDARDSLAFRETQSTSSPNASAI